jgi:hypothetical protein
MTRFIKHAAAGMMMAIMGMETALAGEANTSASATTGRGHPGNASATANYDGVGGEGFARTRTDTTGGLSLARGVAVGFDGDGLDFSFSHAIAPTAGPAYAGTFNMSIGTNGQVSTSYGGTLATGGAARTASAGGATRSDGHGANAQATATGNTVGGGQVNAWTRSNSTPSRVAPVVNRASTPVQVRPAVEGRRPISIVRSQMAGWR